MDLFGNRFYERFEVEMPTVKKKESVQTSG